MNFLDKRKNGKKDNQIKKILRKIFNKIKLVLLKFLIPLILIIVAAALIVGIIEAVADAISEAVSSVGEAFTVNESDGSIEITDEQIDKIIDAIYNTGVNPESLGLLGELDKSVEITDESYREALRTYIREFYEAQVVTETLNYKHLDSTDDKTYGAVYVYRATADEDGELLSENRQPLTYISYEDMENYVENNDLDARNYFSINENGELVVASTTQTKVETGASLDNLKEEASESKSTITMRTVNYKTAISKYTTQLMFLVDLLMISQNPEFVSALVDLIKDSRIEITIMDTVTTNEFTETYTYTPVKKWVEEVRISDTEVKRVPRGPEEQPEETEITKTTTISTTPNFNITYVKTWFCEQSITYNKKTDGPNTSEPNTQTLENEPEPSGDEATWKENITYTTQNTSTTEKYEESVRGDVIFNLGESGDGRRFENGELEEHTFVGLMETKFKLPNTTRYAEAGTNLESGADMLFQLLQKDQTLQNMETIMRYALYKYSGNSYGVTELDFNVFDIDNFSSVTGAAALKTFIRYWEGTKEEGDKYIVYLDTGGNRTVGYGVNIEAQGSRFIAKGIDPTTIKNGDRLDKEIIDSIEDEILNEMLSSVRAVTSGLDLKEYQIYALVSRKYNCGNINGFTAAYNKYWKESDDEYEVAENESMYNHPLYTNYMSTPIRDNKGNTLNGLVKRRRAEWLLFKTGYSVATNSFVQEGGSIIEWAKIIHEYMEQNSYLYCVYDCNSYEECGKFGDSHGLNTTFEESKTGYHHSCCATYVSWVLQEAGYLTPEEHSNGATSLRNTLISKGFIKINNKSDLIAGDILCYDGHIEIYAGDGMIYNAGSGDAIRKASPYSSNMSNLLFGLRAPQ